MLCQRLRIQIHSSPSPLSSFNKQQRFLASPKSDLGGDMERELVELFEAAKKAADAAAQEDQGASSGGPKVDRCLDVLNQLRSFPVSYDVLVSTQVAKRLRPLTKHPAKQIQTRVVDVLEIWKKIIVNEATRKKNDGIDIRSPRLTEGTEVKNVKVEEVRKTASITVENFLKTEGDLKRHGSFSKSESINVEKKTGPMDTLKAEKMDWSETVKIQKEEEHVFSRSEAIKVEKKVETVNTVKAEKNGWRETANAKVEKISNKEKPASSTNKPPQASSAPPKLTSMIKCNEVARDRIRELLLEAFSKVPGEANEDFKDEVDACDPIRVAVSVESAMFEKMGRSTGAQKIKYRSIMFNLKDVNNPDLRRKVLLGQVKPERLVDMSPEEMASDERQREIEQIKEKALFECERAAAPKASTNQFKCGRCGKRETTYFQLQTRSADEPMTTFVTCVNCQNHWKFC
ncbi:transcription elongation factor TFIIS isoform X2 [Rhododendron vialii]|uniref:transcription elongation factor TFIIS isoform X2 n=1 Tax=Rhododendron vialii TaxID=182163 RepID=UPI00265DD71E|nr:transcription elongation factor TFIIS isoform X2 [Rhododendron vialii]